MTTVCVVLDISCVPYLTTVCAVPDNCVCRTLLFVSELQYDITTRGYTGKAQILLQVQYRNLDAPLTKGLEVGPGIRVDRVHPAW